MTHSAIPWTVKPAFRDVRVQRIMSGYHLIAETLDTTNSDDALQMMIDAEFIVKAVNNHESLVRALDKAIRGLQAGYQAAEWDARRDTISNCLKDVQDALAKADAL